LAAHEEGQDRARFTLKHGAARLRLVAKEQGRDVAQFQAELSWQDEDEEIAIAAALFRMAA
jgi:hypothetical protein